VAVAFILKGYPRLSESFIAQEILGLERRGLDIRIVSLRHPTDAQMHPVHLEIKAPALYLPEYLKDEPARVGRAWQQARRLAGYAKARTLWLADLRRDFTANRVRRFGQACVVAAELPPQTTRLHAHFLHTPASVARYAATMMELPWSCSAHAKDIWTSPDWELREKLGDVDWLVTCTAQGANHLRSLAADPEKVGLVYHGLDLARFPVPTTGPERRRGRDDPVLILSIGRAVAKKGFDDLLQALAALPEDCRWRFEHIGDGECLEGLKKHAQELGLSDRVHWLGAQAQGKVLEHLRSADLFVLASKIAPDGDRDGLPNVLMEAQSQGLPVVATRVSAIPELIEDGETGLLAAAGDPQELTRAIARLIANPALRQRLGSAGETRVRTAFDAEFGLETLAARFASEVTGTSCRSRSTHH
jgi:glycosyltransferase involved in cell wall biosynthesis